MFLSFLYFDSGFVSKKIVMKWMVVLLLFLFGCYKHFFFNRYAFIRVASFFSGTDRASLGLNTTFFLALIFFLLLYSSPFFFFTIRSYSKPCLFSPSLFRYEDDRRLNS